MSGHVSTERMNDALDGLLDAAAERRLEAHLQECGACRESFARLSEVVADMRALPRSGTPPEDLWAGIASRVRGIPPEAPAGETSVLAFPDTGSREARRRWSLTGAQLAAAAVVVALLSATLTWSVTSGPTVGTGGSASGAAASAPLVGTGSGPAARAVSAGASYDAAVSELEAILAQGRELLAPETLLTIDASLRQIDEAMAEVREALAEDPSSEILARMLAQHRTARIRLLTQAANAVQASL